MKRSRGGGGGEASLIHSGYLHLTYLLAFDYFFQFYLNINYSKNVHVYHLWKFL